MRHYDSVAATKSVVAPTGTFSQSLTVSGEPVATGTGGSPGPGVRSLNDLTDDIQVTGAGSVTVSEAGQTVTISGTPASVIGGDHATLSNLDFASAGHTGFASSAELASASGTLSTEIDSEIATHAADPSVHHTRYTDSEARSAVEPTTSALAASGVATEEAVAANAADIADLTASGAADDAALAAHVADPSAHHTRYSKDENDALTGSDGITIVSGTDEIEVQGFFSDFTSASGSLQDQIDALEGSGVTDINQVIGSAVITGTQNVATQTAGQAITIIGPDLSEYVTDGELSSHTSDPDAHHPRYTDAEAVSATAAARASVSGSLSAEIDSDISTHAGVSDAHHARYSDGEAVAATSAARASLSGTLSTEIDSDIAAHAAIPDAHHSRYTDAEANAALEPTTSALAASGVATDANVAINAADIAALTQSGTNYLSSVSEDPSPSLSAGLDANDNDIYNVDSLSATLVTGDTGAFSVGLTVSGAPVNTSRYTDAEAVAATASARASLSGTLSAEIDSDVAAHAADVEAHHARYTDAEAVAATASARSALSGTLSAEIDADIANHASIPDAHHARYTDSEAILALEPTTSELAASGVGLQTEIQSVSGTLSNEIDSDIAAHGADESAHHTRYSDSEAISATESARSTLSGTLSAEIDSEIAAHAVDPSAHHSRYSDDEARSALEPTTSALAASGVATASNLSAHEASASAHHTRYQKSENDAILSGSALITVTSGSNTITLTADSTPLFDSVSAATGTFSDSLTVSGNPVRIDAGGGGGGGISLVASGTTFEDETVTIEAKDGVHLHVNGNTVTASGVVPRRGYWTKTTAQTLDSASNTNLTDLNGLEIPGADGVRKYRVTFFVPFTDVTGSSDRYVWVNVYVGANGGTADGTSTQSVRTTIDKDSSNYNFITLPNLEIQPDAGDKIGLSGAIQSQSVTIRTEVFSYAYLEVEEILGR